MTPEARIVRVPFLLAYPPGRYAAQVLIPNIIFVRAGVRLTPALIAHELGHVEQIRRLGLIGYWFTYLRDLISHRGDWYAQHALEVEAEVYAHTPEGLERARRLLAATA